MLDMIKLHIAIDKQISMTADVILMVNMNSEHRLLDWVGWDLNDT